MPVTALIVIIVTAVSSTYYLQSAMAIFPNNQVVPVYYVTFTLASVCAGAIVYREFDCMTPAQPPLFSAGCLTTFIGVFLTGACLIEPYLYFVVAASPIYSLVASPPSSASSTPCLRRFPDCVFLM